MSGETNEEQVAPVCELIDGIETRDDFVAFVAFVNRLVLDLQNKVDWENHTLESYLLAVAAWTDDMDGAYKNRGEPIPQNVDWKTFATVLSAATVYE